MSPSSKKIITIVGGGPAGSATAISLLQSTKDASCPFSLILLDDSLGHLDESIGETIPPAATPVLSRLDCLDLLDSGKHLECPGSASIWGSDRVGHNDFLFDPVGVGYHLDRREFDADLLVQAESLGCQVKRGWHLRRVEENKKGYRLECLRRVAASRSRQAEQGMQEPVSLQSDFVVDASGKGSVFCRRIGIARNVVDQVVSVCAFYDLPLSQEALPARTLVQAQENGWWYAARLPNNRAIISFCTDVHELGKKAIADPVFWHQSLLKADWFYTECNKQFGISVPTPKRLVTRPAPSSILSAVSGENWLAVGDAASSYDSFTSAGITRALMNGEMAGKAVAHWLSHCDRQLLCQYQSSIFEQFNDYIRLNHHHYSSERRYADCGFWRRRLGAVGLEFVITPRVGAGQFRGNAIASA